MSPYAQLAAFLIALGVWRQMSKTPPQWNDLCPLQKAADHILEAANDLCVTRDAHDEDDPLYGYYNHKIRTLRDIAEDILPTKEGWPEPKNGMGVVLPFIPRQTG